MNRYRGALAGSRCRGGRGGETGSLAIQNNSRLAVCVVCGSRIFMLEACYAPYGLRQWWHEDSSRDDEHIAKPARVCS